MSFGEHKFQVQTADDAPFVDQGLRGYFEYRDLGIGEASGGRVVAQINKAKHKVSDTGDLHHHVLDFQMNYILKGWAIMWFEGHGEVRFEAGTAFNMPPNIKHSFLACSDDFETLEICMPADFDTVVDADQPPV